MRAVITTEHVPVIANSPGVSTHHAPPLVWYAAYGSNLHYERFICYLRGGRPPGSSYDYAGARDPRLPRDTRPITLNHRLYFTGASSVWGGSPAFVDTKLDPTATTLGRIYLISTEQFADLTTQENHGSTVGDIPFDELHPGESLVVGPGRYANVLCVGQLDGMSVLTLTAPWAMSEVTPTSPATAYLRVIAAGLRETYALDDVALATYLSAIPGVSLSQEHMLALFA